MNVGMGDLRASYRFLAPALRAAGYRVACTDLRGHGDSDTTFSSYGDDETAGGVVGLIGELGGPAVVVGNSMGAGPAVLAAAQRPGLVCGLVLVGPFVRDPAVSMARRVLLRAAMARRNFIGRRVASRLPSSGARITTPVRKDSTGPVSSFSSAMKLARSAYQL
jgi:pimeloyl-ACP methyl ester carboxylesterase